MVGALQQYKHHPLKGQKANCSILPFQQLKHLVLYGSGCPQTLSETLQSLGSPWCVGLVVWWISFQPLPRQTGNTRNKTKDENMERMSSWLEKKNEESRIHFVHNFYGLPLLQISSFKSECVMPTSLNASTLISLEQNRHVQLYEEESVFLLSLEYSVPAFASI